MAPSPTPGVDYSSARVGVSKYVPNLLEVQHQKATSVKRGAPVKRPEIQKGVHQIFSKLNDCRHSWGDGPTGERAWKSKSAEETIGRNKRGKYKRYHATTGLQYCTGTLEDRKNITKQQSNIGKVESIVGVHGPWEWARLWLVLE